MLKGGGWPRMVTIKEIADALGVAVSTVSKSLSGASDVSERTRERVLDAAVAMGYAPKKVRAKGMKKLCVLVDNMDFSDREGLAYDVVTGFRQLAARSHWEVEVLSGKGQMREHGNYDSFMLRNGMSGAFLLGFRPQDPFLRGLEDTTVPTVLFDRDVPGDHIGYVGSDSAAGIRMLLTLLCENGHKRIAFLNGPLDAMVSVEREETFCALLREKGLEPARELIARGEFYVDYAPKFVEGFLKAGATAILCASDVIAAGVLRELSRLGVRVPEEVSVAGFDDLPIAAKVKPALTTVRQDRASLGKSAFLVLDGLLHGVQVSKMLLRPTLVVRASVGPVRGREFNKN